MGKLHAQLKQPDLLVDSQHVFFVGTARVPLTVISTSRPKAWTRFASLVRRRSPISTSPAVGSKPWPTVECENGRMTIRMFCAFEGAPLILRLYGRGRVVEPGDAEWDEHSLGSASTGRTLGRHPRDRSDRRFVLRLGACL